MLNKIASTIIYTHIKKKPIEKHVDIPLKVISTPMRSHILAPVASIRYRKISFHVNKQHSDYCICKTSLLVNKQSSFVDSVEETNLKFTSHWQILKDYSSIEIPIETLNYFSELDQNSLYSAFIHYSFNKVNLYTQSKCQAYRSTLLLLNKIIDNLCENNNSEHIYKLQQIRNMFFYTERKIIKTLIRSVNFNKTIEKQQLTADELIKVNRCTKYTQTPLLQYSAAIKRQ